MAEARRRHHLHSPYRRGLYSFLIVASVLLIGTVGIHYIENIPYIDSFYFMSMLATAQGPPVAPVTATGKIFASIMAFVSVGSVIAALGFIFGPLFGVLWKIGVERLEEDIKLIEEDVKLKKKK